MNNERYFSQYVSPNIIIVPTTSCNPPSPKRRKISNNITVPIVDNAICEDLKPKQENKPDDCPKCVSNKNVDESSSKSPTQHTSWAAKYLHSIGLDKKSSIWNRRIPRKTASQQCVVSTEPPKNATNVMSTSSTYYVSKTDTEKSNKLKIPQKVVTVSNALKDSNNKIQHIAETKNLHIKDKLKKEKQLHQESSKSHVPKKSRDEKPNKSLKISSSNNATVDGLNKINDQSIDKCTFGSHRSQSGKVIKKQSQKDNKSKLTFDHSPIKHYYSENKVKKSKIRSVVIKDVQKNRKVDAKAKHNQTKNDSMKQPTSSDNNNKGKCISSKFPSEKLDPMKHIKTTKICDKLIDFNNLVLKKAQNKNTELKTKSIRSNAKTISKEKTKDKLIKGKKDLIPDKNLKPIKRKILETEDYRQIKLVINIICNKDSNVICNRQSNESSKVENNSENKACTVSSVDVEFLDDIDIDEIVESLDSCAKKPNQNVKCKENLNNSHCKENSDKHNVISNILNDNNNTDIIDLIKTLKGEEDDDFIRISNERSQNLLLSNVVNNFTKGTDNLQISSNFSTKNAELFPKEQENNELDNLVKITAHKNVGPSYNDKTSNTNNYEKGKETQQTFMNIKSNDAKSQSENVKKDISDNSSNKLGCEISKCNMKVNEEQTTGIIDTSNNNSCINESPLNCITSEIVNVDNVKEIVTNQNTSNINTSNIIVPTQVKYNGNECLQNKETTHQQMSKKPDELTNKVPVKQEDIGHSNLDQNNKICSDQNIIPQYNANIDNITNSSNLNLIQNELEEKVNVLDTITPKKHEDHIEEQNLQEVCKKNEESDSQNRNTVTMGSEKNISAHKQTYQETELHLETTQKLKEQLYLETGSKYSIDSVIHTGRFSKIIKCRHPNGKYYAVKMPTTNVGFEEGKNKKNLLRYLVSEIPKNNLFIVNLVNSFNLGGKWCFLMEYYPKNLNQALDEIGRPYPIEIVQDYAKQLVMALMVLKNKRMVHLDIKPQHVLINSSNNLLKLCGFDFLCRINKVKTLPNLGTANYRAPEVIIGYESGYEIDVWSTALVLYEMAAHKKLFPGTFNNDILYKQICTLGSIPYQMITRSKFGSVHFIGSKFMKKSGFKGQCVNIISKFYKNNRLRNSIYNAYFENWGNNRSQAQQNCDTEKISQFVTLLQKMLNMCPEHRIPIEFVYANRFINETDFTL